MSYFILPVSFFFLNYCLWLLLFIHLFIYSSIDNSETFPVQQSTDHLSACKCLLSSDLVSISEKHTLLLTPGPSGHCPCYRAIVILGRNSIILKIIFVNDLGSLGKFKINIEQKCKKLAGNRKSFILFFFFLRKMRCTTQFRTFFFSFWYMLLIVEWSLKMLRLQAESQIWKAQAFWFGYSGCDT